MAPQEAEWLYSSAQSISSERSRNPPTLSGLCGSPELREGDPGAPFTNKLPQISLEFDFHAAVLGIPPLESKLWNPN